MFSLGTFSLNALPVLMLATGFFWSRSLDVFHYFGAAKPPKMDPQHGAMLDLVLGSIFDRFWEVFLDVLGAEGGGVELPLGRGRMTGSAITSAERFIASAPRA